MSFVQMYYCFGAFIIVSLSMQTYSYDKLPAYLSKITSISEWGEQFYNNTHDNVNQFPEVGISVWYSNETPVPLGKDCPALTFQWEGVGADKMRTQ